MIQFHLKKGVSDIQNSNHGNCTVNCLLGYKLHSILNKSTLGLDSAFPVYTKCF